METETEDAAAKAAKQERRRANLEKWKLSKQQKESASSATSPTESAHDASRAAFHTFDHKTVKKRIEATKTKHERTTLDGDAMVTIPSKIPSGPGVSQSNSNGAQNGSHPHSSKFQQDQVLTHADAPCRNIIGKQGRREDIWFWHQAVCISNRRRAT
jgi:hypothetical protein